jgi:hypothetical protein
MAATHRTGSRQCASTAMAGGGRELAWRFYFSIGVTNACDNDDVAAASCLFMGLHTFGLETMQLNQRRQIGQQGDSFCSVFVCIVRF